MAESRAETKLRTDLHRWLDRQSGPHPHWDGAPAASRVALADARPRWVALGPAAALAAAAAVLVVAMLIAGQSTNGPAATPVPTPAPWPSLVPGQTNASIGEIPLGGVGVATSRSEPAVLVRVSPVVGSGNPSEYRVEYRVVGAMAEPFGIDRLVVVRDGVVSSERLGSGITTDPLAIGPGTPTGTVVSAVVTIDSPADQWVDLGFIGAGTSPVFWFPIHRPPLPAVSNGGCPTLADYKAAAAQPSQMPARPSFAPVAPDAPATSGILQPGEVGIVAGPDGRPGVLVRVSNPRYCDRLPDVRPEEVILDPAPGSLRLLLVDVEFTVLESGTINGFIPGTDAFIWVKWRSSEAPTPMPPYTFPGSNPTNTVDTSAGYSYRGAMAWIVEGAGLGGRIAVEVGPPDDVHFEYMIQDGSTARFPMPPLATPAPGATPPSGYQPLDRTVVVAHGGAVVPVTVGDVAFVAGYPLVMPATPGDRFVEVLAWFGRPTAEFTLDPTEWVLVGPDGRDIPVLQEPQTPDHNTVLPLFALPWTNGPISITPADELARPFYVVAEVPPTGRITLEYRPGHGPAQVTWIIRDQ